MNAVLSEGTVIELMRQEQIKAAARAEELWAKLKEAETAMQPYKDVYDKLLWEWSEENRMAESLGALVKAKEPQSEEASAT